MPTRLGSMSPRACRHNVRRNAQRAFIVEMRVSVQNVYAKKRSVKMPVGVVRWVGIVIGCCGWLPSSGSGMVNAGGRSCNGNERQAMLWNVTVFVKGGVSRRWKPRTRLGCTPPGNASLNAGAQCRRQRHAVLVARCHQLQQCEMKRPANVAKAMSLGREVAAVTAVDTVIPVANVVENHYQSRHHSAKWCSGSRETAR